MVRKSCSKCDVIKPTHEFYTHPTLVGEVEACCKDCKRNYSRGYGRKNASAKARSKKLRAEAWANNPYELEQRRIKAYNLGPTKDDLLPRNRYTKAQREERTSGIYYARKRRTRLLHATPPWLSGPQEAHIKRTFALASLMKEVTGKDHHVDHIIPLQGDNVCGLHVPWNLQVLPAEINLAKSNKHNDW